MNLFKISVWLYIVATIIASLQKILMAYPNNYLIFKYSFLNLLSKTDLYILHPTQHIDLFKYSPFFAFIFAPFAVLPDYIGAVLWNLTGTLVFILSVKKITILDNSQKAFILFFCFFEFLTSTQNFQSNVLLVGLMVFVFNFFENKKYIMAALFVALLASIKIYGAAVGILFLFYPNKTKFLAYSLGFLVLLSFLPVVACGQHFLVQQYIGWFNVLGSDYSASLGFSVMGIINTFVTIDKYYVLLFGFVVQALLIYINIKYSSVKPRLTVLCSLIIWMVIFNHKSESPTFILAVFGFAAWFTASKKSSVNYSIAILVFVFTTLSPTFLFPDFIRTLFGFHIIKTLPCLIAWIAVQKDLFVFSRITKSS
jgi:hypothetical protein